MIFRPAVMEDVRTIVQLLANDQFGVSREDADHPEKYAKAFEIIDKDPNHELIVAENEKGEIIGTFQLTYLQYLTHQGSMRVLVEAVRVRNDQRGKGVGEKMFLWAINRAKEKGARLMQLTSDKRRPDAIRFYEKLGFVASHEGFKLSI